MAKSIQKLKAQKLRKSGKSIIKIASVVGVAKSTVSLWCRDIELTEQQKNRLLKSREDGLKLGQLMGAAKQKKKRLEKIENYRLEGMSKLKNFNSNDFFVFGLALYLGEGSKSYRKTKFTNSNPELIKMMILWFKTFFAIPKSELRFHTTINTLHKKREADILHYWSDNLNIPLTQFCKTTFVASKQKKIYENYNNYYGTLHFRILKGGDLLYRILGLINGVFESELIKDGLKSA